MSAYEIGYLTLIAAAFLFYTVVLIRATRG